MTRILTRLVESKRGLRWLALTTVLWLATAGAVLAAPKKKEEVATPTKSYVTSYILVIMALGLGMMAVLRPSARSDTVSRRAKDDQEE